MDNALSVEMGAPTDHVQAATLMAVGSGDGFAQAQHVGNLQ